MREIFHDRPDRPDRTPFYPSDRDRPDRPGRLRSSGVVFSFDLPDHLNIFWDNPDDRIETRLNSLRTVLAKIVH